MMTEKQFKLLKLVALIITITLVCVLISTMMQGRKKVKDFYLGEIQNNDSTILAYGDDIFFLNSSQKDGAVYFKLTNKNEAKNKSEVLIDFQRDVVQNDMHAYRNKLFYSTYDTTYMYDIETGKITKFADGVLQLLTGEWYVTLHNKTLYKGIYYSDLYNTKSISPLIKSGSVEEAFEDEKFLYYKAYTSREYQSLLALDKETLNLTVYDVTEGNLENINNVASNDKYVFEIITRDGAQYLKIIEKSDNTNKEKIAIPAGLSNYKFITKEEIADTKSYKENIYFVAENASGNYEIYKNKIGKDEIEKIDDLELTELSTIAYTVLVENSNEIVIKKSNETFARLTLEGQILDTIKIVEIDKIKNDLYFRISINPQKYHSIILKVAEDGTTTLYE